MSHPRHVVPKGTVRRILRQTRKLREVAPVENPDTRSQARAEINATIPMWGVEAGRRELADIHARARQP